VAQHRLAADLLVDQPEVVARHAAAAGQPRRACLGWLLAAEDALARFAAEDAEFLASQALSIATELDDLELRARSLVARGHGRDAQSAYEQAHADFVEAADLARTARDPRLEMAALRAAGGDVTITVAETVAEIQRPLERMLAIARSLGDRAAEADALGRLTVLATSRLDFVEAGVLTTAAVRAAAGSNDPGATEHALDARKHLLAYQGIVSELPEITSRLADMQRRNGDLWSLQWTVFESAFAPLAAEDYPAALELMTEALELNRRSGFVSSESWYLGHIGWVRRLLGDLPEALSLGAESVEKSRRHGRHRWWASASASLFAASLLADHRPAEAIALLEPLRPVGAAVGDEGYRLRVLAPLAEASGDDAHLRAADALFTAMRLEPGHAWLLGADAHLSLARAWLARGERPRAVAVLDPFMAAATHNGWAGLVRQAAAVLRD
jgi:tetratricopeptide (TPR) repeat protein